MSMDNLEQQSTNDSDTITSAIDVTPLYTAIQHDYEGDNISNIIIQLLQIYQPKDGINAYKYALRKVQDLLEECGIQKKQLLLSMIPSPHNTSHHMIKEIFHTTTGFIKLNLQENKCQNTFDTKNMDGIMDNIATSSEQSILHNKNYKSSLSEVFSFRGFPENEISMIPSHMRNDTCTTKMCTNTEMDLWQDNTPRSFNDVKYKYKNCKAASDKNKKTDTLHMIIDIDQDAIIKQKIKDDIHKMDVCGDQDQNITINVDDFVPIARSKLKTSIKNFLKRAQEGIFIELPAFPHIRLHPQIDSLNFTSKSQKPRIPQKVLQNFTSHVSNIDSNSCLFLNQNTDINVGKNQRELDRVTKQKASVNMLQKKCSSQEFNRLTELQLQQNNLNYNTEKKTSTSEYKENNMEESRQGYKIVKLKSDDINSENNFQARSMFQLAAYKKRYYDTLLNVQRAKVALSNSLAAPSNHLTAYDDPYYSNYICQQQHLLHQQRHFTARPQFSTYPTDLAGLSNVHGDQHSCAKSICKYLLLKQLRLQQQTSPLYARNQSGWIHRYIGHVYPYSSIPNGNDQTKYCVRRKNLEDIVGKLKETEHSNLNN